MVAPGCLATGWSALDALLGGGWPRGALVEIRGRGRTSLIQAAVGAAVGAAPDAAAPRERAAPLAPVVWIDGSRSFCPETSRGDPRRLTLVRPPAGRAGERARQALLAADLCLRSRAFGLIVLDLPPSRPSPGTFFRLARRAAREDAGLLVASADERAVAGSASGVLVHVTLVVPGEAGWGLVLAPGALEVDVRRHRRGATGRVRLPLAARRGDTSCSPAC